MGVVGYVWQELRNMDSRLNGGRSEVAFIDTAVSGWEALAEGVPAGIAVVLLDSRGDGLSQLADWAAGRAGHDAFHILSHGGDGYLKLGALTLDAAMLAERPGDLDMLGAALKPGGDILLYGCELAGEPAGNAWLDLFADLTGANVAASTNLTGATDLGGDFVLAARIGVVTTQGFDIPAFTGVLSTLDTLPTLTATGVTTTFVDESNALSLFSGSTASTNDAGQVFTSLTMTVTGVLDEYEILNFQTPGSFGPPHAGMYLIDANGWGWITQAGQATASVSVSGTTATVIFSGFEYSDSELQDLINSFSYNNLNQSENSAAPSDGTRVITITSVTDNGASNNTASLSGLTATINLGTPSTGTLPTLTATGATATFAGSASPPDLFSSVAADTNDSGQLFTSLTLTVTGVLDAYEMLGFSMPNAVAGAFGTLALVNGASFAWVTTSGSVGGTVSVTGTTATVTLSGFGYTASEMQSLVDSIAYNNTAENNSSTPSDGARVITLTSVTDDGASNNTASLAGSSATVNIGNVTPPPTGTLPTLTATGATASYPQGTSTPVDLFSSVTADTNDVGQSFVGFSITISGLADMMEGLTVPGVLGGMSSAGGQVDVGGIPHGSYTASGSANAQTYDFAFTTPITAAQLQSIIDGIGYINQAATVTAGPRTITLNSVTDNGSSNNVASLSGISATVNVTVPNPPIVQSAAVDGSTLVLTYDQALDATNVAQVGTFGVNASGGMHPGVVIVTAVAVDSANKTVTLTLQRPILSTETVTVSYTDPTSGNDTLAVQNIDGDDAGSIFNMAVTNNTSPPVGPALVSATVNYTSMTLTFDDFLDQFNVPLSMAFSVSVDSSPVAVSSVTVNNDKTITLALNAPVASGQTVTITYTDTPGDDLFAIQSTTGADTATFTNQSVTNNTPAAPALQSATVNGSTLVLTYDQMLDAINGPTGTNFSVMADSMLVTVTTATVDTNNMTVTLTLASPVAAGAVVTVTYIDPTTGDDTGSVIQSMGGIDAAGFTSQSVTNNTPGGPALVSAAVDGATLTLTFDDFLDQLNAPQLTAFGVTVGGSPAIVNSVIVNADKTVTLTLTTPVTAGQIVTVSYTDPTAGNDTFAIQSATGSDAASFTGETVTNNTVAPPALQSATIDGNTLVMTYDQALDGVNIPTSASFSVFVGAGLATITNVAIDGPNKTVTLTLSAPVAVGDTVAVSYNDPTAGDDVSAVQSAAGVDAASITSQSVTNNTAAAVAPAYVSSIAYIGETTVTLAFDLALDSANPPIAGSFTVEVNGTSVPVTGVTVNGVNKTVTLTLDGSALGGSGTLTAGDIIDFTYTDPTVGNDPAAIQGTSGLDAASFNHSYVVATVRPAVAPTFVSAAVDGASLVLTYDQALDALHGPTGTDFTVTVDSQSVNVTNVVVNSANKTVTLTLATPVTSSQAVTVAYTDPTNGNDTNAIQSSGGLDAASLPATSVTNNTSAGGGDTPPTLTLTPENQGFWSLNGSTGYDLFDTVTASTVDNGQTFTGMVLKVYNVAYGTEYLNIGGTDITLAAGTGSVAGGSYAVTLANGVATVTLSGLSLSNSDMGTLIDGIAYKVTNNNSSIGQGYTRPVVLESVTDSGASNNTTTINEVATVTFVDSVMMPTFFLSTTPDSPTYNFTPGVPTQVTFTATVLASTTMIGSMVTFSLGLPQGWTATPSGTVPSISGLLNLGTTYTLTYDITASGTDTSGAFPVSLIPQTTGISLNYSAYSSSAMVTVGPPPAPAFVSAAVNGTSLVLTYDQALDALNAPAGTDFTVMVDSQSVNVTNVVIDGVNKTVTLTLATPVTSSQTVSIAYTDPTNGDDTNAIQGSTGVDAASLPATSVTNNTPPPSAPLYVSSLAYIGENTITLTFDVALDGASPPAAGDFDVQVNGTGVVVSGVSVNSANKTVTLTLDTNPSGNLTLLAGDIIDFAYTDPTAGDDPAAIQGTTGIDAADFNQSFIVTTIRPVTFQSATVDGATLTMTYDQALASLPGPAPGAFTVMVGGNAVAVNSVLVDGPSKLVILSLATPVTAGQSVTVAYTDPSGSNDVNAIQDITGNDASSLTTTPVTNNTAVSTGNTPPLLHAVAANDGFQNGSGGSGVDLFNLTVADTLDIAQAFVGFTLTVHGVDGTANEKITIHGLDIDLVDGGSYNSPDLIYNVSVTGDIATVTFVGMTAQVNEITDRIDNLTYSNTGTLAGITPGDSAFRAIVLRSVRDSGGSDNVTQIEIATGVTIAQSAQGGGTTFGMVAKAIDPTVTFDGTTPQKVEFLVTLESALSVIGTTIGFAPALPTGWTAGPVVIEYVDPTTLATSSVAGITGLQTIGTMYKVSFDVTAIGSEVSGSFPIGLTSTVTAGILSEYPRLKSGVAMMSVELPPDVTPPDAPEITSSSLTKDDTPVISGTAEAGATITLTIGGATYTTTATGGNWSIDTGTATPTSGSLSLNANGTNAISVTATDAATNVSTPGTQTLTIDTTAPAAPVVTSANLTNSATPTISGTAEAGATITLTIGGATYTTTATGGNWSVDTATATPTSGSLSLTTNGTNPVSVTATDTATNVSTPGTQTLTIDTMAPAAPVITSANLTNSGTPTISGTAEAGATITLIVGGATYTTTATGGNWSVDTATATPTSGSLSLTTNGTNPVSVTATDPATNVSTPGTQTLTIDTMAPAAPVITSANLTNSATPTISGTAEAGATITLIVGGATYTTTATGGNWSIDTATATPTSGSLSLNANGTNAISVTATDAATNVSTPGTQTLTIDTTAPAAPVVTSANLTNSATPVISGTAEAGATITLIVGGATYTTTATGGNWSVDTATATPTSGSLSLTTNGTNPVSVTATDPATNVSTPGTQTLTIDTMAPAAPVITSANLTNSATPTISGTAEAGATITLIVGGATYTTTATGGNWSVDTATATPTSGSLWLTTNGTNPVSVTATDPATNVSTPGTQTLTIDTMAPAAPVITSANLTNTATPTISGTAEAGATITLTIGGATYTTTATGGNWSVDTATATPTSGSLSLTTNGTNAISVTATDAASNVSSPGTQTLTIDTTAPAAPVITSPGLTNDGTPVIAGTAEAGATVILTIGGATYITTATGGSWSIDTGTATPTSGTLALDPNGNNNVSAIATDAAGNISGQGTQTLVIDATPPGAPVITSSGPTNDSTPVISGTAEAGTTITLTIGGATYTTTAIGGVWSIDTETATPTSGTLALNTNGDNSVSVTATDPSGNVSAPATQTLTIDTTAPGAPVVTSPSLTGDNTPVITGTAEAGSIVTLTIGGATYTTLATDGVWSIDTGTATPASGTLTLNPDGDNGVTVTATDPAGNISGPGSQTLVIDSTAPAAPGIDLVPPGENMPAITGTAEAGSIVTVTVGGATYTTVATGGTWTVDLATATPVSGTLSLNPAGDNAITATATDGAGNVSAPGNGNVVIDATPPEAPTISSAANTGNPTPVITGTAEAGATVTVTVGGAIYSTVATDGAWSIDLGTATPVSGTLSLDVNGTNTITATATDAAGNVSAPGNQFLVIDTTAPTAVTVAFEDTTIDAGEQVNVAFTIAGAEPGASYVWTITSSGGGSISGSGLLSAADARISGLNLSGLGDGALSLTVTVTDAVGNISPTFTASAAKVQVTAEKPVPEVPAPVENIDGALVEGGTATLSDGTQVSTVVIVAPTESREEDPSTPNQNLADVPVVRERMLDPVTGQVSTVTTLSVGVPIGVNVTSSGNSSRTTGAQSLTDLIREIEQRTDAGSSSRTDLTGGGTGFLSVLPQDSALLVRSIDLSGAGDTSQPGGSTLQITGNTLSGTLPTAIVLNTSAANTPITADINNVEFIAVIGQATLIGGEGNQAVYGDASSQVMILGPGDDLLSGGGGNDTIASTLGNDTLSGDEGDDVVHGGEGDDWVMGGADNDLVGGGSGNDYGFGGTGNDTVFGEEGDDILTGNEGNDTVDGGTGNDTLFGEDGDDLLHGGEGDDIILGGTGNDTAMGGDGDDLISLGEGDDIGVGGTGNDILFGDEGNDTLFGGEGDDIMNGGAGDDLIFADGGADTLWGGEGADTFAFGRQSGGTVIADFQVGVDRLAIYDAGLSLADVIASARLVDGNTVLDLGNGGSITILGVTGPVATWFLDTAAT